LIWCCKTNPTCTKSGDPNRTRAFAEPESKYGRTKDVPTAVDGKQQLAYSIAQKQGDNSIAYR
jgi:hypothetical protein